MTDRTDVNRPLLTLAALLGALGVALAARASHAGESNLAIAANFLLFHAPVLMGISLMGRNRLALVAGVVLAAALAFFVGDLAASSEWGHPLFPFAAPIGGVGMIGGWVMLAISAWTGWRD